MCGSGTFAIEAALFASNTAPGLRRAFAAEEWTQVPTGTFSQVREDARAAVSDAEFEIFAYDIDHKAVEVTRQNMKRAGFEKRIWVKAADVADLNLSGDRRNVIVCNPPYGERLSDAEAVAAQTRVLGRVFSAQPDCRSFIISSSETFEKDYGKKADKNRKLYNGMIKTYLYQYLNGVRKR